MDNHNGENLLVTLSESLADAAERGGASTVLVNGRSRLPASGTCYSADLVLTANHVIERDHNLSVSLPDGSEIQAALVGRDPGSDLALLRLAQPAAVPAEKVPVDGRIGQFILALGRPTPVTLEATFGVISSKGGPVQTGPTTLLESYLRTDAIPYPGFSGGPLVDIHGRVLGINSSGLNSGVSFTIPASLAWRSADSILQFGAIRRGYLGIQTQPVDLSLILKEQIQSRFGRSQEHGLMLVSVEKGSPAASGGLLVGDILIQMDRTAVEDHDQLLGHIGSDAVGKTLVFDILRGGCLQAIRVEVGERK